MNIDYRIVMVICPLLLLGCGAGDDGGGAEQTSEHVWSDQTGAIDKAEDVNKMVQDAAARQRQAIDEQSR